MPHFNVLLILLTLIAAPVARAQTETIDGGWYDAHLPVPVLHLEGSIEDVARGHGTLLGRHPENRETILHFGEVVDRKLDHAPFAGVARWIYRRFIRAPMIDHVPLRYKAAYELFANAAGVSTDIVWNALVLPDAALRTVSLFYGLEATPPLTSTFGCTSIIWNSGRTSALHGRNLDYDGVGYWDRNPLVLHVIPQDGLAYVSITAMGIHAPGITAFNEAGLSLAVHQLTFDDTQSSGTPMPVISAEIVRNARTIDDAIAIVRSFPRAGGWAYVVAQGRDRAVIETSANEVAIRRSSEPFFFQTNHVASPAMATHQIYYSAGSWLDSFERAERLAALAKTPETAGWASPELIVRLLGDYKSKPTVAGGTIAKLDNIQSVIMDAAHRRLWIATGTDVAAPNEHNYVEYRWSDLRAADPPEVTGAEIAVIPESKLGALGHKLRELLRQTVSQRLETRPQERLKLLATYVRNVREAAKSGVPPFGTWAGLFLHVWFELKENEKTDHATLLATLELALRDPALNVNTPAANHRRAQGRLFKGRLLDLMNRRSEALFEYSVAKRNASFARLQKASEFGLRRPFNLSQAQRLKIDWAGIDLY